MAGVGFALSATGSGFGGSDFAVSGLAGAGSGTAAALAGAAGASAGLLEGCGFGFAMTAIAGFVETVGLAMTAGSGFFTTVGFAGCMGATGAMADDAAGLAGTSELSAPGFTIPDTASFPGGVMPLVPERTGCAGAGAVAAGTMLLVAAGGCFAGTSELTASLRTVCASLGSVAKRTGNRRTRFIDPFIL